MWYTLTKRLARKYKEYKDEGKDYMIDDGMIKLIAKAGYVNQGGSLLDENFEEGYKPYYEYLKYGYKPQQEEEVKEEPIMIEDNYNYTTPYSFEYEPYLIEFDHEVDTNNSIQMIEELYNEEPITVEEDIDSNDVINIVDVLTNKISNIKKSIIHYISNYRPIMNQYTHNIEAILIE